MRWARSFFERTVKNYEGDECLIWPYATVKGYAVLRVDGKLEYVCRLVCPGEPLTPEHQALHDCGNGAQGCVAKRHLYWGTQKENIDDTLRHGTRNRGQRNGRAKLSEVEVCAIKRLLRGGMTRAAIGEQFGVSREAINEIAWGKNWSWLREDEAQIDKSIEFINDLQETP